MSHFPDEIDAGGVLLRPMQAGDLPVIVRHLGDPEIARWMAAVRHPFGPAEAEEILALSRESSRRMRVVDWNGAMVGCLGLLPDVWFWLDRAARGQGIMRRAMQAAIAAHFADAGAPLIAASREDNLASQALLSGLGFSRMPEGRRMFFAVDAAAHPCHAYVMTPEQWLMLHPPVMSRGALTLRPAVQKDAPALLLMLPGAGSVDAAIWPEPEALSAFIETHRCRRPGHGLYVALDDHRRTIGMALFDGRGNAPAARFLTAEDAGRHGSSLAEPDRRSPAKGRRPEP